MGNYNTSFSIMYMTHVVISYIFLMQFLVAVLSAVYDGMIQNGDFYAIQYQYIFITKYMRAIEENNGYDKLIVYPPPLNFILAPLLLVAPSKKMTKKVSQYFVNVVFWIENIFFIILYFFYFLALDPIILTKMYYQFAKMEGKIQKLIYMVFWTLFGFFFLLYFNVIDTCMLVNILCLENSVVYDQNEDEKVKLERHKFYIYRDIYRGMQEINNIAESTSMIIAKKQNLQRKYTNRLSLKQKMRKVEFEQNAEDVFVVKRDFIMAAYLLISNQNPYIRAYRQQYQSNRSRKSTNSILLASIDFSGQDLKGQKQKDPSLDQEFKDLITNLLMSTDRDNIDNLYEFMQDEKDRSKYIS